MTKNATTLSSQDSMYAVKSHEKDEKEELDTESSVSKEQSDEQKQVDVLKRKRCRNFTITVSPPLDRGITGEDGRLDSTELDKPRSFTKSNDRTLVPEEFSPDVSLERTESCLPGLEDMLEDAELRELFNTSECHRDVQEVLVMDDGVHKYDRMLQLVMMSYTNEDWRKQAAEDQGLVDSLVLFCRQKTFFLEAPKEESSAGAIAFRRGRYSRLSRSFTSQSSISRSSTPSRGETGFALMSPQTATGSLRSFGDLEERVATAIALITATLKLLRNLCVESVVCQEYIYEHRFVDFLVDYFEVILEAADRCVAHETCSGSSASWTAKDVLNFPRVVLQFLTNGVSGNAQAQAHVLKRIFPDGLTKLALLTYEPELMACFLHNLWLNQPGQSVATSFLETPGSVQIIYCLLVTDILHKPSCHETQESNSINVGNANKKSENQSPNAVSNDVEPVLPDMWKNIFLTRLVNNRTAQGVCLLPFLVKEIMACDVANILYSVSRWPSAYPLTREGCRLGSPCSFERRSSGGDFIVETVLKRNWQNVTLASRSEVLCRFCELLEKGSEASSEAVSSLVDSCLQFPSETLGDLLGYLTETSAPCGVAEDTVKQIIRLLGSLCVEIAKVPDRRTAFDTHVGIPLLERIVRGLEKVDVECATADPYISSMKRPDGTVSSTWWPVKSSILLVANLCYKSPSLQHELHRLKGICVILKQLYFNNNEDFIREASIFAVRCACHESVENQSDLEEFLRDRKINLQGVKETLLG